MEYDVFVVEKAEELNYEIKKRAKKGWTVYSVACGLMPNPKRADHYVQNWTVVMQKENARTI